MILRVGKLGFLVMAGLLVLGQAVLTWQPCAAQGAAKEAPAAGEYARHFDALMKLTKEVADAMPAEKYGFKPHPDSMDFGSLMNHIATTNLQFCAGLADTEVGGMNSLDPGSGANKPAVLKYLADSFAYCSHVVRELNEKQLEATHNSPDGKMPGWDVLLAMFVHVAHHRGQAEIYLRDNGIAPPRYRI